MAKQLNARVQTKRDTEQNWNQAINFIPKDGEIIIYKADTTAEELQTFYEAYLVEVEALKLITNTSSTEYQEQSAKVSEAFATYNNRSTRIVPRFKVGNGENYLKDLPFVNDPFVVKEEGKGLSECNYDKRAHDIIENLKEFEDNNTGEVQYTDTKYTNGVGLGLLEDIIPSTSQTHTFYNTGVVSIQESAINGSISVARGNSSTDTTVSDIAIHGLTQTAYTLPESFATAKAGERAMTALQNIATPFEPVGAKDLTIQKLFDLGFLNTSSIPDSAAYLLSEEGKAKKIEEIPSSESGSISYLISLGLYPYDVAAQTMLRGTINLQKMDEDDNLINLYAPVIGLGKMAYIDEVNASNINLDTLPIMIGVRKVETTDENGNITETTYLSGHKGLVPTPTENDYGKVLFSDGSWRPITDIAINIGDVPSGLATDNEGKIYNSGILNLSSDENVINFTQLQLDEATQKYQIASYQLEIPAAVSWTSTLTSGEQIGKLTINNTENILYASVASDRVAKAGDTMTGRLIAPAIEIHKDAWPQLLLSNASGNPRGMIFVNTSTGASGELFLRAYSSDTAYAEAYLTTSGTFSAPSVEGAVFNDYAEYRSLKDPIESYEPGYCMTCNRDGKLFRTSSRMQHCEGITSDTFGFSIGRTDEATVPLAVAGRVLVYTSEDPSTYYTGQAVCASRGGRVSKMTDTEVAQNPDRIVGVVSEVPTYETWGTNNIKVNGRIWITVK